MNSPLEQTIELVKSALQSSGNSSAFVVLTHPQSRAELITSMKIIYETLVELHEKEKSSKSN